MSGNEDRKEKRIERKKGFGKGWGNETELDKGEENQGKMETHERGNSGKGKETRGSKMGKEVQGSKERKEEMIKEHDNENGSKDRKEEK